MLGKKFGKGDEATIIGKNMSKSAHASNDFRLEVFLNILHGGEESSYKLEKKLTIGSEIGDIVIDDDELSPRHCTFILNSNQVVTLLDHSSQNGTFLNKKKLDPGKTFFVSVKDKVKAGKCEIKIEIVETPIIENFESDEIESTADLPVELIESLGEDTKNIKEKKAPNHNDEPRVNNQELSMKTNGNLKLQGHNTTTKMDYENVDLDEDVLDSPLHTDEEEDDQYSEVEPLSINGDEFSTIDQKSRIFSFGRKQKKKNNEKKKKTSFPVIKIPTMNAFCRLISIFLDFLLSLILIEFFSNSVDYKKIFLEALFL